jgi:DDE superfamily endonuclease
MFDPARLVFIDETATSTNMVRLRGRCLRGERLVGCVPHGHWKTSTLIAGLRHDAIVAPFVINGAIDGNIFRTYVEQCLAPTLDRGDIVFMDNLSTHKVAGVKEAIGCRCDGTLSACVFSGPQPDRTGLQQAQGAPAQGCGADNSRTLAKNPHNLACRQRDGMPEFLPPCRL